MTYELLISSKMVEEALLVKPSFRSAHHRFLGTQHPLVLHRLSSWPSTLIGERQVSHLSLAQRDPSLNHSRLRLGCFLGTFSPSARQIRSTRLWFTRHPSQCNKAVILRYP